MLNKLSHFGMLGIITMSACEPKRSISSASQLEYIKPSGQPELATSLNKNPTLPKNFGYLIALESFSLSDTGDLSSEGEIIPGIAVPIYSDSDKKFSVMYAKTFKTSQMKYIKAKDNQTVELKDARSFYIPPSLRSDEQVYFYFWIDEADATEEENLLPTSMLSVTKDFLPSPGETRSLTYDLKGPGNNSITLKFKIRARKDLYDATGSSKEDTDVFKDGDPNEKTGFATVLFEDLK